MNKKMKIIIADDNKSLSLLIKKVLGIYEEEFEVLGIAETDEEEIEMIERLKPEIIITDLRRNNTYSGLEIIRYYSKQNNSPKFLVCSSELEKIIGERINVVGYIQKGSGLVFEKIIEELRMVKGNVN